MKENKTDGSDEWMDRRQLEILKKYLTFIKETTTNEYVFRCPICGDSNKPYHGHFYVSDEGKYICFKCGTKGNNVFRLILKLFNVETEDKIYLLRHFFENKTEDKKDVDKINKEVDNDPEKVKELRKIISEFQSKLHKHNTVIENNILKEFYYPFLEKRISPHEDLLNELLNRKVIVPFYSSIPITVEGYKPSLLLNRIYFKYDDFIYHQRKINDILDIPNKNKSDMKKYIFYIPELINHISTFVLSNNISNSNVLFLVEGAFDVIKLYGFLRNEIEGLTVSSTNGKNFKKTIIVKLFERYKPKVIIYIPDKDVKRREIIDNLNKIRNVLGNDKELLVGIINHEKYKDVGDFQSIDDIKKIEMYQYQTYVLNDLISLLDRKILEVER